MAKISPTKSKGISIPVDSLAPKTRAKPVTMREAIPLIPAFDTPSKKAQKAAIVKWSKLSSSKIHIFYSMRR